MSKEVKALKVTQWLEGWDNFSYDSKSFRRKPEPHFFIFSMSASELKALSGIHRRTTKTGQLRSEDLGIQRRHDQKRSGEIADFVQYGYPLSELSENKRKSKEFNNLGKPGWLPTAVVMNILSPNDVRQDRKVSKKDLIQINDDGSQVANIILPESFSKGSKWNPEELHPIEIIDGQHRLWAFEDQNVGKDYQLPVVAFYGLDISWQAYLFWTINIKPKRINASLAFDLYPLLRTEDWLEKFDGHSVYRESRAQELTESLWAHPQSPWYQRINMLGESGVKSVSQSAWVRSLMATYVKSWEGTKLGGLFGAKLGAHKQALQWSRAQQAAFLILVWEKLREAIEKSNQPWTKSLREQKASKLFELEDNGDLAFSGQYSLLNTDQGVRAVLHITNDLFYLQSYKLKLDEWSTADESAATDEDAVLAALESLKKQKFSSFIVEIVNGLSGYDWRVSSTPGLLPDERTFKAAFRGSGGYRELRLRLLMYLSDMKGIVSVSETAETALKILK